MTEVNQENNQEEKAEKIIGLIGNPNCGKTTLFNALTDSNLKVGNWPGVTVERKSGHFNLNNQDIEIVDLPGIYSLDTADANYSLDEQVARDYLLSNEANCFINIIDASNIERNLFLTTQLLEMNIPVILVLNMMDVAKERGIEINLKELEKELNCPIFSVIASKKQGINELKNHLSLLESSNEQNKKFNFKNNLNYPNLIKENLIEIENLIEDLANSKNYDKNWLALKVLEGDYIINQLLNEEQLTKINQKRQQIEEDLNEDIDIIIADTKYNFIGNLIKRTVKRKNKVSKTFSDKLDNIVLNRFLGIPIFLFMMYLMFMFTINVGGLFNDFFGEVVAVFLVDGLTTFLESINAHQLIISVLADGFGGGVETVSTFIPIIGCLFIFLSVLEDSGYMVRAAFVMDRFMRFIGLQGKSFVPLIVGFGCNVPAVMATRTIESERERKITMAMAPFVSCGARLPIWALFVAAFFAESGHSLVFMLYLVGLLAAVFTGLILKNTLLAGQSQPFIMELPSYHIPTVKGVLVHSWSRLKAFVIRASILIIPMVMIINILNSVGTDGTIGHQDSKESVLSAVGETITPVFEPMGLTKENWPAAVGIVTGILAKEAVVGTLNALYIEAGKTDAEEGEEEEEEGFSISGGLSDALDGLKDKFLEFADTILDPIGLSALDEEVEDVEEITYTTMRSMFPSNEAVIAYLLLVLLYFPCVAVIGAVHREAGFNWAVFVASWSTGLAYCISTFYYKVATFSQNPINSISWIIGILIFSFITFILMRNSGKKDNKKPFPIPVVAT